MFEECQTWTRYPSYSICATEAMLLSCCCHAFGFGISPYSPSLPALLVVVRMGNWREHIMSWCYWQDLNLLVATYGWISSRLKQQCNELSLIPSNELSLISSDVEVGNVNPFSQLHLIHCYFDWKTQRNQVICYHIRPYYFWSTPSLINTIFMSIQVMP